MAMRYYRALIMQDEGDGPDTGFGVVFPDLPGCTSAGDTVMEAAHHAAEALTDHIALLLKEGQTPPAATRGDGIGPDWLAGAGRLVTTILLPVIAD